MAWFRKDKQPLKAQDKRDLPADHALDVGHKPPTALLDLAAEQQ